MTTPARAPQWLLDHCQDGWETAARLAKEKLVRERRFLPMFVYETPPKEPR